MKSIWNNEHDEDFEIVLTYTIIQPLAMMVKLWNTFITRSAVFGFTADVGVANWAKELKKFGWINVFFIILFLQSLCWVQPLLLVWALLFDKPQLENQRVNAVNLLSFVSIVPHNKFENKQNHHYHKHN